MKKNYEKTGKLNGDVKIDFRADVWMIVAKKWK